MLLVIEISLQKQKREGRGPVTTGILPPSLKMLNPESFREIGRTSRAVGSLALDTGQYQHSACGKTETFNKGAVLKVCANRSCPNKGANWALQEKLT